MAKRSYKTSNKIVSKNDFGGIDHMRMTRIRSRNITIKELGVYVGSIIYNKKDQYSERLLRQNDFSLKKIKKELSDPPLLVTASKEEIKKAIKWLKR